MKKISVIILVILGLSIFNIFWSTGYFRIIENKFEGEILTKINIVGAEDITINHMIVLVILLPTKEKLFLEKNQKKEA